ncbi:hypothetical protein F5Y10DRAFT_151431 [Nemania abortiva]|nr:hypothetical protein F5Y10DRAFT_151431 [Nemania abortiva]
MTENSRRKGREQPRGASSSSRYSTHDANASARSYGSGAGYRPSSLSATSPNPRNIGQAASYSGYYQEPTTSFSQMGYPSEYGQDSRQTQGYGAYTPSMLYNVPQTSAQGAVYDTSQQFPARQAAGLQMMPAEVATPYFPSEPTNAAAAAAAAASMQPQTASSSTAAAVYQQNPQQSFTSGMAPMGGIVQAGGPEPAIEGQEYSVHAPASGPDPSMKEAYASYQRALRDVFTNIQNGALHPASESLLTISEWLLTKVGELGLTGDDELLHGERLTLWHDFNNAWLSLCQKQKDMYGSQLQRGQSTISKDQLTKMGNDLVRLCNSVERYGLVDYEYGVWEERIFHILHKCYDAYDNKSKSSSKSSGKSSGESSHRSSHRRSK